MSQATETNRTGAEPAAAQVSADDAPLRLQALNRVVKMVIECSAVLIQAGDEQTLLDEICRLLVESGGYRMAWVGYAQHDEQKSVRLMAQAGYSAGYLDEARMSWADNPYGRGPTGLTLRTGAVQINRDFQTNPAMQPWREAALARNYQSSIGVPLKDGEGCFGILSIYSATADAFDQDEAGLLIGLANNLAHGICALRDRLERARAEQALRESEELFSTIFEASPLGVAVVRLDDQRLINLNAEWEKLTGLARAEQLGARLDQLEMGFSSREGEEFLRLLRERQLVQGFEMHLKRRDGESARLLMSGGLVEIGGEVCLVAMASDITERVRLERELREQQLFALTVMNAIGQGLTVLNAEGKFEFVNLAYAQILGRLPAQILGRTPQEFTAPEDLKTLDEAHQERLAGKVSTYENHLLHISGARVPVQIKAVPRSRGAQYTGSIALVTNLSEKKQADELLQKAQQRQAALIEHAPDGILLLDNLRVSYASPAVEKLGTV